MHILAQLHELLSLTVCQVVKVLVISMETQVLSVACKTLDGSFACTPVNGTLKVPNQSGVHKHMLGPIENAGDQCHNKNERQLS